MEKNAEFLYGGISGVEMAVECFDLGESVVLRSTYAHLFAPHIMAFAPPGPHGYHPAPWKPAEGGFSFDIAVELTAPSATLLGKNFDARETIWWIAALLRLSKTPYLSVPVLSDQPFESIPSSKNEPVLMPFETEGRIFQAGEAPSRILDEKALCWIKEKWVPAGQLMNSNPRFYTAVKAFDSATVRGRTSASLLALWGAIEQLFAGSRVELRFRVASYLASYLEPRGPNRLDRYKQILKLYDKRSTAAHTAEEIDAGPVVQSYVLLRNALVRMIDENRVPTQEELEALLFDGANDEAS